MVVERLRQGAHDDPFDALFTLEEQYYREGLSQGTVDGARAGRIEGRLFGYEKAFEKFIKLGKLHGRAVVLQERARSSNGQDPTREETNRHAETTVEGLPGQSSDSSPLLISAAPLAATQNTTSQQQPIGRDGQTVDPLPPLQGSQRLAKHIDNLHALTEPATFSTHNDEDAVADFDDRLRRAEAKAKLIDRLLVTGDAASSAEGQSRLRNAGGPTGNGDMEEFTMRAGKVRMD